MYRYLSLDSHVSRIFKRIVCRLRNMSALMASSSSIERVHMHVQSDLNKALSTYPLHLLIGVCRIYSDRGVTESSADNAFLFRTVLSPIAIFKFYNCTNSDNRGILLREKYLAVLRKKYSLKRFPRKIDFLRKIWRNLPRRSYRRSFSTEGKIRSKGVL